MSTSTCFGIEDFERLAAADPDASELDRLDLHLVECLDCRHRRQEWLANQAFMVRVEGATDRTVTATPSDTTLTAGQSPGGRFSSSGSAPASISIPGYELRGELHRGGQGVVYEALQLSTKRKVAIKVMLEGPFASRASRNRFQREVELVAALRHPNVVVIHESGEAHGNAYFAMDLIRGRRLDEFARAHALTPRGVVGLMRKVCDAVCAAHRQGVMHRDLKPSNILVDDGGEPHVLDFGLAKSVQPGSGHDGPEITRGDYILGTLKYMSPEQTRGSQLVDMRTDVYSLGVILYELLTGAVPYRTDVDLTEAVKNIREVMPGRPSRHNRRVNSELDAIVLQALEKSPDRRYQSAGELAADLSAWLEGRPVLAKSKSSLYLIRKIAVRHWSATAIVVAFVVTILSFSAISFEAYLRATEALRDRNEAEVAAIQSEQKAGGFEQLHFQTLPKIALVGALQAWRDDNLRQAARYEAMLPSGAPEREALEFLLNPNYAPEALQQRLGPQAAALAFFVCAERDWKAGCRTAAVEGFNACISAAGDDLVIKALSGTRLKELGAEVEGETP